jgi:hypothetical protein
MFNIDIDEFLPNETLMWISQQLKSVNVDLPNLRGADLLADDFVSEMTQQSLDHIFPPPNTTIASLL